MSFHAVCPCVNQLALANTPAGYGLGCAAHDAGRSVMPACGSVTPPAFCARAWCYVLATCVVSYSYDGFVDTALSNVTRSYETCGQLPSDQSETIINETLSSQPLRVLLLNNSAGWTGSYLDQNGATVLNHETFAPGDEIGRASCRERV